MINAVVSVKDWRLQFPFQFVSGRRIHSHRIQLNHDEFIWLTGSTTWCVFEIAKKKLMKQKRYQAITLSCLRFVCCFISCFCSFFSSCLAVITESAILILSNSNSWWGFFPVSFVVGFFACFFSLVVRNNIYHFDQCGMNKRVGQFQSTNHLWGRRLYSLRFFSSPHMQTFKLDFFFVAKYSYWRNIFSLRAYAVYHNFTLRMYDIHLNYGLMLTAGWLEGFFSSAQAQKNKKNLRFPFSNFWFSSESNERIFSVCSIGFTSVCGWEFN